MDRHEGEEARPRAAADQDLLVLKLLQVRLDRADGPAGAF
jgi:hypothetical protein